MGGKKKCIEMFGSFTEPFSLWSSENLQMQIVTSTTVFGRIRIRLVHQVNRYMSLLILMNTMLC